MKTEVVVLIGSVSFLNEMLPMSTHDACFCVEIRELYGDLDISLVYRALATPICISHGRRKTEYPDEIMKST